MLSISSQLCVDVALEIASNAATFSSTPSILQLRSPKLPDLSESDDTLLIVVSPDQQQVGTVATGMSGDVFLTNVMLMQLVPGGNDGEPIAAKVDELMADGERLVDLFRRGKDFSATSAYPGGARWESCVRDYVYSPQEMLTSSLFVTSVTIGYTVYKEIQ